MKVMPVPQGFPRFVASLCQKRCPGKLPKTLNGKAHLGAIAAASRISMAVGQPCWLKCPPGRMARAPACPILSAGRGLGAEFFDVRSRIENSRNQCGECFERGSLLVEIFVAVVSLAHPAHDVA